MTESNQDIDHLTCDIMPPWTMDQTHSYPEFKCIYYKFRVPEATWD